MIIKYFAWIKNITNKEEEIINDLKVNDRLLIDDGRIVLGVSSIDNYIIDCEVILEDKSEIT